jgi:nucleolar protein 16
LDADEWSGFADDSNEQSEPTDVVRQLEALAASGVKTERTQSEREREWIERLVAKYGRDYKKMARDRKLNPFQQTEGDIRRRVAKWEKKYGGEVQVEA